MLYEKYLMQILRIRRIDVVQERIIAPCFTTTWKGLATTIFSSFLFICSINLD